MTYIVVEYKENGSSQQKILLETETVGRDQFEHLLGVWHCVSMEECHILQEELKEMRHVRSSQPA